MDYIRKSVNGIEFAFASEFKDSRNGFSHVCDLYANGEWIASAKRHYLNRTWERYRYQSVMLDSIRTVQERMKAGAVSEYKREHGIQRLRAENRERVEAEAEQNPLYKTLEALRQIVYESEYGTEEEGKRLEQLDSILASLEALKTAGIL